MEINSLPYILEIDKNSIPTVDARNPFVSYDLEQKRKILEERVIQHDKLCTELGERQLTDEEAILVKKSLDLVIESQIDYYSESIIDFQKYKDIFKKIPSSQIAELNYKLQISQFGGSSEKKNHVGDTKKKGSSQKGTKKKK
jgi:hypothetical protein